MQDSRILVFGKNGQVGKALQVKLANNPLVTFIGRDECDLASADQIKTILEKHEPQIVVNAAAYTAVDKAEQERELSNQINAAAPGVMAQYISQTPNGKFVHYSTDYVFDGMKKAPYLESDITLPIGQYGKSKRSGEISIQSNLDKKPLGSSRYFILRTSWVYGDGSNFIKTMLRLAGERDQLKVIADQHGVPSSAEWLADIAIQLIASKATSGIYHAVPDGQTTWHGLACFAIQTAKELGCILKVNPEAIQAISATEYPLPAPRPYNSRMDNRKLKDALQIAHFPQWESQVSEYVKNIVSQQK